ncbi:phage tail assembly chaperone [Xenorhabdus griffiniae]|uniref:phage tail assembly chaperone n=1 Tax=Xenorhabdus griffiniae TaxID=351672 RepID=UPI00235820BD|nr:putative phage tail assembly chaperone [Xenorhabdus griffiniae]MDC9606862.1 putative phage tail assembly chaperone [Xenorhabdus griffiniae]
MNIDNITYEHRQSNFIEAKNHALKLIGLLKGCISTKGDNVDIDIGAIAANIGSPEMQGVEQFVFKYVTATDENGETLLLQKPDVFNSHFNTHRSHYFQLIFDGLKFHFADFLPAGVASAKNINLSAILSN